MRPHERAVRGGARTAGRNRRPGSRPARLAEASKQLAILLEDVDLDAEADLGEALTDAVLAVERAVGLVDHGEGGGGDARADAFEGHRGDVGDDRRDRETGRMEDAPEGQRIESGGLRFVGEAGAE